MHLKVPRIYRRPAPLEVCRARASHVADRADPHCAHRRVRKVADADADVEPLLHIVHDAIDQEHPRRDLRVCGEKLDHDRKYM
jgi:hypothetical protein